jgi:hypothetical protein
MKKKIMGRVVVTATVILTMVLLAGPDAWANTTVFGGYVAPATASASGDLTVPASSSITCRSTMAASVKFSLGLSKGQYPISAGFVVQCIKGSPIIYVAASAGTASFRFAANGGDVIAVSMSETASATTVTATDTTTTVNETANFTGATSAPSDAVIGASTTTKSLPLCGPVTFSSLQVDGSPLVSSEATSHKLIRAKSHAPGEDPGPLSSGSFTLTQP